MPLETPEAQLPSFTFKKEYIIGGLILILALIPSVYFYRQYQLAQARLANPTQFAGDEAKKLVADVSKLMTLPIEETPTIATVNDKEKLKNQPFFAKSENGDKVLIYTTSKKAILYRPSINKIIDVAPVNIGPANQASSSGQVQTTPSVTPVTFQLLNGTTIVGLTKKYETELLSKMKNASVVDKDNAIGHAYEKSLLIAGKNSNSSQAQTLAQSLGLTMSTLPEREATPTADFLIILGLDKK